MWQIMAMAQSEERHDQLDSKQRDRLENAHDMYVGEYENERQNAWSKAGGQEHLAEWYKQAIAHGIADRLAAKEMKDEFELLEAVGEPPQ